MDIIEEIVNELKRRGMWFTTELDPVFAGFGRVDRYIKLDEYGYVSDEKEKARIEKEVTDYIGDGAVDYLDAITLWIDNAFQKGQIAFKENLITSFVDRPVVDNIDAAEVNQESHSFTRLKESKEDDIIDTDEELQVSIKEPLVEENQKSKQVIDNLLTDDSFNADTPQGKVILRTSKIFNELSKDGYDVQISFDNGEGIASIAIDKKGGAIVVPIGDNNKLSATLSGNIPLNVENMNAITDVFTSIASL